MKKALLVIDLQEDYIEKCSSLLISCINKRIQIAIDHKELVVYLKNTKRLRNGRKTNKLVNNLNICSEYIISKETASAFSNTELQEILRENQIAEIEIAGIERLYCKTQ